MRKSIIYIMLAGLVIGLSGCQFKPVKEGGAEGEQAAQAEQEGRYGVEEGGPLDITALEDPNSPVAKRVVYFPLDSVEISDEDRDTISAHARLLSGNPDLAVVLEGHADERGTREGQNQIQVISFGEERPVALGHDEEAWRLNRRVEFLYSGY
jgi:peptidoglycan-associated lipoprotein